MKYHQLPSLEDAGLRYYKTIVFDAVKREITEAIIDLINRERNGAMIDKALIKSCIEVYEKMGMGTLDAYVADFETQLLTATRYVCLMAVFCFRLAAVCGADCFL